MPTDAYYDRQDRLSYVDRSAALTTLKQQPETAWLNEASRVPTQQALRHLETAWRNFFAGRAKYPTFHKKHGAQSATYASTAFREYKASGYGRTLVTIDRWYPSGKRCHAGGHVLDSLTCLGLLDMSWTP
jgi:transposase